MRVSRRQAGGDLTDRRAVGWSRYFLVGESAVLSRRERGPIRRRTLVAVMVLRSPSDLAGGVKLGERDCFAVVRRNVRCEAESRQLLVDGPGGVRLGACRPCKRTLKGS